MDRRTFLLAPLYATLCSLTGPLGATAPVLAVGVGGAGLNILKSSSWRGRAPQLAVDSTRPADLPSHVPFLAVAGYEPTRTAQALRELVQAYPTAVLFDGLGGATASNYLPTFAHVMKESGATVHALVTTPFRFEGKIRSGIAAEAIALLRALADSVTIFENDAAMSGSPNASLWAFFNIQHARIAETALAQSGIDPGRRCC